MSSDGRNGKSGRDVRWVNGVLSAIIGCFFLAHSLMGGASMAFGFESALKALAWAGVAGICAHVVLCAVTSYQMMTDTVRPPSSKKKRHMALKWATGALLLVTAAVHFTVLGTGSASASGVQASGAALALALLVVLAAHLCIGAKSLLKDLNIDRTYRTAFRAVVVVLAVVSGLLTLSALF